MKHRSFALALALVGASAFAVSVQAGQWWSVGDVAIGPFGARACFGGECSARGLAWIGGGDLWLRSAIATWVAGLVAMVALVALAGALAARRVPRLVARTSLMAIATAVVAGGYFFVGFPGITGAGIDRGAVLFVIGVAAGIAAAVTVLRVE